MLTHGFAGRGGLQRSKPEAKFHFILSQLSLIAFMPSGKRLVLTTGHAHSAGIIHHMISDTCLNWLRRQ